jgi:hypothetical protein
MAIRAFVVSCIRYYGYILVAGGAFFMCGGVIGQFYVAKWMIEGSIAGAPSYGIEQIPKVAAFDVVLPFFIFCVGFTLYRFGRTLVRRSGGDVGTQDS